MFNSKKKSDQEKIDNLCKLIQKDKASPEKIKKLLAEIEDVNQPAINYIGKPGYNNQYEYTLLNAAAMQLNFGVMKLLIDRGADVDKESCGSSPIINCLFGLRSKQKYILLNTTSEQIFAPFNLLLEKKANIISVLADSHLHSVCYRYDFIKSFLQHGAEPNKCYNSIRHKNSGDTFVHYVLKDDELEKMNGTFPNSLLKILFSNTKYKIDYTKENCNSNQIERLDKAAQGEIIAAKLICNTPLEYIDEQISVAVSEGSVCNILNKIILIVDNLDKAIITKQQLTELKANINKLQSEIVKDPQILKGSELAEPEKLQKQFKACYEKIASKDIEVEFNRSPLFLPKEIDQTIFLDHPRTLNSYKNSEKTTIGEKCDEKELLKYTNPQFIQIAENILQKNIHNKPDWNDNVKAEVAFNYDLVQTNFYQSTLGENSHLYWACEPLATQSAYFAWTDDQTEMILG